MIGKIIEQKSSELGDMEAALGGPTISVLESQLLKAEEEIETTCQVYIGSFLKSTGLVNSIPM